MPQISPDPEAAHATGDLLGAAELGMPEMIRQSPVVDINYPIRKLLWFALFVRPRHEKSVQRILAYKGYQTSLPLQKCRHARRSGSHWENEKPLISRYVFVKHDPDNPAHVVTTPGVLNVVGFARQPYPIPAAQIEELERIANSRLHASECLYPGIGDSVKLVAGPLKGLEGIVSRARNATRLVVNIPTLQRSVAVEIDTAWAMRVQPAFEPSAHLLRSEVIPA
jgi:transcription termination/antitermination protein NusG